MPEPGLKEHLELCPTCHGAYHYPDQDCEVCVRDQRIAELNAEAEGCLEGAVNAPCGSCRSCLTSRNETLERENERLTQGLRYIVVREYTGASFVAREVLHGSDAYVTSAKEVRRG